MPGVAIPAEITESWEPCAGVPEISGAVVFTGFSLTRTDEVVDLVVAELPGEVVQEF
jgi:hypothetical protein